MKWDNINLFPNLDFDHLLSFQCKCLCSMSVHMICDSLYDWRLGAVQVALKTLIVIHRSLREGDPTFREELLNFSLRTGILQLSNFKDDSSPIGLLHSLDIISIIQSYMF